MTTPTIMTIFFAFMHNLPVHNGADYVHLIYAGGTGKVPSSGSCTHIEAFNLWWAGAVLDYNGKRIAVLHYLMR